MNLFNVLRRVFAFRSQIDAEAIRESIRRDAMRGIKSNWIAEGRRFG